MENKQIIIMAFLVGLTIGLLLTVVMTFKSGEMVCFETKEDFFEYQKETSLGKSKVVDMYNSCVAQQQTELKENQLEETFKSGDDLNELFNTEPNYGKLVFDTNPIDYNLTITFNPCYSSKLKFLGTPRVLMENDIGWLATADINYWGVGAGNVYWIAKQYYVIDVNTETELIFNTPECIATEQEIMKRSKND